MRSLRVESGPTSCFQAAMRLRGLAGLTVIIGSSSCPVMSVSSKRAPGQPPAKGLGPEIAFRRLTLYGLTWASAGRVDATATRRASNPRPANRRRPAMKRFDVGRDTAAPDDSRFRATAEGHALRRPSVGAGKDCLPKAGAERIHLNTVASRALARFGTQRCVHFPDA